MAVAPPVSIPKNLLNPSTLAVMTEARMVITTNEITKTRGCQPSAVICSRVIRIPSKAIPKRSTSRAVNSIPALHFPFCCKKVHTHPEQQSE